MIRPIHHRAVDTAERRRVFGALASPHGALIEVVAEPGMGKSRLVADLHRAARQRGLPVRCLRLSPSGCSSSPGTGSGARVGASAVEELWESATGCVLPEPGEPADDAPPAGGPGRRVLLVDDVHWAGRRIADLLEGVVHDFDGAGDSGVLVVLAHRPRQSPRWLSTLLAVGVERGLVDRVELLPFTLDQAADLLGVDANDEWLAQVHRDAEGVPLYLLALAYTYLARPTDEPDPFGAQIPRQVGALISSELALLGDAESALLSAGAVLGDRFELAAATEVAGLVHDRALAAVAELVRRDVLRETERQTVFVFRHRLLRQVAYLNLGLDARARVHRAALEVLGRRAAGVVERAVHLERLADRRRPEDVRVLVAAARECVAGEPDTAARFLEAALRGRVKPVQRAELTLALAKALAGTRPAESRDVVAGLLGENSGASLAVRVQAVALCATLDALFGQAAEADAAIASELHALPADPPPEVADLLLARSLVALTGGTAVPAADIDTAFRLSRRHGNRSALVVALVLRAYRGAVERGDDKGVDQALPGAAAAVVDRLADTDLRPEVLVLLGWSELLVGMPAAAERHLGRAAGVIDARGPRWLVPLVRICLSVLLQRRGRHLEARDAAALAHRVASELDAVPLAEIARALESQSGAVQHDDGPDGAGPGGAVVASAISALSAGRGRLGVNAATFLASAGELDSDTRRAVALIIHTGGGRTLPDLPAILRPRCYEMLTLEALAHGEPREVAADWASRAEQAAEALDLPCQRAYALLARAHLARADHDAAAAAELYRRAAGLFGTSDMAGAQACAFGHAAECAALAGRRDYARSMLLLAKAMARQCGASNLYVKLDTQLRELDAPPTRRPVTRTDPPELSSLTEREREIAGIAGTGKRTKEIAEQLSLSPRTVDVHLGRIYRKLNIESRAELARIMAAS